MKKKLNIQFIAIMVIALVATMILSVGVFYQSFKKEVFMDMKTYTHVLKSTGVFENPDKTDYNIQSKDLRVTIISSDGNVIYDNEAYILDMDNHGHRQEVEEAFEDGEGSAVRKSETLNKDTFYYAIRLDNGNVLRIAKESSSIWSIFMNITPGIVGITIILLIAVVIITNFLTRSIISPIEKMANDLENMGNIKTYKELQPFIDTIKQQHEDILKNAKMRQEFTANVSHELKTPLTSISGYSELIENGMATDDDVRRFAGEIHKNSNRLLTLINDIIRLSELDVTESEAIMDTSDLYEVAQNAVDMLQLQAQKHDVTLSLEGKKSIIIANKMMLEELVYNLTSNAIRYNRQGGNVWVSVLPKGDDVQLKVKDTGIGIPKEHQERIFERFYRVDKSRSKSTGGTGLGLAIVKHIVARHDAKLELNSEEGKGTEITVTFKKANE